MSLGLENRIRECKNKEKQLVSKKRSEKKNTRKTLIPEK